MTRLERLMLATLIAGAVLVGVNVIPAAGRWNATWKTYNDFGLSLTAVRVDAKRTQISVGLQLINLSNEPVRVIDLESQTLLNGQSISANGLRPADLVLSPRSRRTITLAEPVYNTTQPALIEQLGTKRHVWDVSGSIEIAIGGQSQSTNIPFSGTLEQDGSD